jgi:hypothetical protein
VRRVDVARRARGAHTTVEILARRTHRLEAAADVMTRLLGE